VKAEFALGEVGGFTVRINGAVLYPIMTAEKGAVWMKLRVRGAPGHGSLPKGDNAVGKLGAAIGRLSQARLPHHRTKSVEAYLNAVAATQKFPNSFLLKNLYVRRIANLVLGKLPDRGAAAALAAALSNTAVPTVLKAGYKTNVVPGVAEAEVDGRTLPAQTAQDLIAEIKRVMEEDVEVEILRDMPPVETEAGTPLFQLCCDAIKTHHPGATPVPYLAPGFTDAKNWSRNGTSCYGFMPVQFPDDGVRFGDLFHGHDERIPVAGLQWGAQVLYEVVKQFVSKS
jgi:acetylornithine deacetylase/succinyl-diaminopimelate desuccinylase-like protein